MKKGFTLVELLAVVIILSIILAIAVPNIQKTLKESKETAYQRSIDGIIEASKLYVTNLGQYPTTETKKITLQMLITAGLLEDSEIIDPRNNQTIDGCVLYTWDDTNNQYKYEYKDADTCALYD